MKPNLKIVTSIIVGTLIIVLILWYMSLRSNPEEESLVVPQGEEETVLDSNIPATSEARSEPFATSAEIRSLAPFIWSEAEASRSLWVTNSKNYNSWDETKSCFLETQEEKLCVKSIVKGTAYTFKVMTEDAASVDENYNIENTFGDYLKKKKFIHLSSVEKGWTTDKTYQLMDGNWTQVVWVKIHSINHKFTDDGIYPTSDGYIYEVFVSYPF